MLEVYKGSKSNWTTNGKNVVCVVKYTDVTFGSGSPGLKKVETGRDFGEVLFCNNPVSYSSP